MKPASKTHRWDVLITIIVLTLTGAMLAVLHFILGLLPFNNIIEALLFSGFGYLFGKKVQGGHWWWGFVLTLPSLILFIYRIYKAQEGEAYVGGGIWLNLFLLPLAASLGIFFRNKYHHHKHTLIDKHFLNE